MLWGLCSWEVALAGKTACCVPGPGPGSERTSLRRLPAVGAWTASRAPGAMGLPAWAPYQSPRWWWWSRLRSSRQHRCSSSSSTRRGRLGRRRRCRAWSPCRWRPRPQTSRWAGQAACVELAACCCCCRHSVLLHVLHNSGHAPLPIGTPPSWSSAGHVWQRRHPAQRQRPGRPAGRPGQVSGAPPWLGWGCARRWGWARSWG